MDHLAILEVLPSCVWISSSICLHLCCLNFLQLLLVLSHGPNHCITSSSPPSIPCCLIAASYSRIFLSISRIEHVLKHFSIAKCTNFPFQRVLIRPKLILNKRVMSISSQRCNLSRTNFRTRNVQCSCHISLYGSSNSLILDASERKFHRDSEYQLFLPYTSLSMYKIW